MEFRAKDIASLLGGEIVGDENVAILGVAKIEEGTPGSLAFLANPKYEHYIYETNASVVLVNNDFKPMHELSCTLIKVPSAYEAIAKLLNEYEKLRQRPRGIEQPSFISDSAVIGADPYIGAFAYVGNHCTIGDNVSIYPQAYIGDNVKIGNGATIYPGVKIYHDCVIGNNCVIHAGTIVGADGFGFAPSDDSYNKIAQIGNVCIEDNVEIGANSCIDRATMGSTVIHKGVKLDNLIQIAHNVSVGENTVIAAQTGVAGSAKIGKHCMLGGQVGVVGHLTIGDYSQIGAQSGISNTIPEKSILRGSPAFDFKQYQKCLVLFRKLPEIYSAVNEIQREIQSKK